MVSECQTSATESTDDSVLTVLSGSCNATPKSQKVGRLFPNDFEREVEGIRRHQVPTIFLQADKVSLSKFWERHVQLIASGSLTKTHTLGKVHGPSPSRHFRIVYSAGPQWSKYGRMSIVSARLEVPAPASFALKRMLGPHGGAHAGMRWIQGWNVVLNGKEDIQFEQRFKRLGIRAKI